MQKEINLKPERVHEGGSGHKFNMADQSKYGSLPYSQIAKHIEQHQLSVEKHVSMAASNPINASTSLPLGVSRLNDQSSLTFTAEEDPTQERSFFSNIQSQNFAQQNQEIIARSKDQLLITLPVLRKLPGAEQQKLLENLSMNLRFEIFQQLNDQFSAEIKAFKESFKQQQIEKIKQEFQTDFQTILHSARSQMESDFEFKLK